MKADLDVGGLAGLAVDDADGAGSDGASGVDDDVEELALGRAVAFLGQASAPVADDEGFFVGGQADLEGEVLNRVFAEDLGGGGVELDDGVSVGGDDEEKCAVAGEGHAAGDGVSGIAFGLDVDSGGGGELAVLIGEGLEVAGGGAGVEA